MRISKSWLKMAEIYTIFAKAEEYLYHSKNYLNFSDKAKEEMYLYESQGIGDLNLEIFCGKRINGYFYGKRMLNITVTMWKKDIENRLLFKYELYNDPKFPHWWLDKIFQT